MAFTDSFANADFLQIGHLGVPPNALIGVVLLV